ncbi:MAG TPA: AraC family ligand binding domain-containing protein [Bryobacteraceae bacterium]|nr:AraC family ligand binding domain-containing protein [Bryobacteraceae bacterium]
MKLIPLVFGIVTVLTVMAQQTRPTCDHCLATYVPAAELNAYFDRAPARAVATGVADQQVRALDVGKSHVDVGVVYRGKLTDPAKSPVAEHDLVSEVYHVIDGEATLVTGPDIEGLVRRPAANNNVRNLNGPGSNGTSIRNGAAYHLKAGDVVVIPAGVGHWFTEIEDHIRYLMIRVDPDKVTPLKGEAESKADLAAGK